MNSPGHSVLSLAAIAALYQLCHLSSILMYWFDSSCDYVEYDLVLDQYQGIDYLSWPDDPACYVILAGPQPAD